MKTLKYSLAFLLVTCLTISAHAQNEKKYADKSGHVSYVLTVNDFKANQNLYFDDYGKHSCIEIEVELNGIKAQTRQFDSDAYRYNVNMTLQTYTKIERPKDMPEYSGANFDFYLENGMAVKMDKQTILGKVCDVYVLNNEAADAKFWVWKNLILKMETVTSQAKVVYEAVNLEMSDSGSKYTDYFQVPAGFKEVSASDIPKMKP